MKRRSEVYIWLIPLLTLLLIPEWTSATTPSLITNTHSDTHSDTHSTHSNTHSLTTKSSSILTKFQQKKTTHISPHTHFNFSRTITLGAAISMDLSDEHFSSSRTMKNSWEMFIEWINNNGGIVLWNENISFSLVCIEDYSEGEYVQHAVDLLLNSTPPVDMFVAPYSSLLTHLAAEITDPARKLLMAGAAANENVFHGRNYTFSTTCPSSLYIQTAFRSLQQFNATRVAVIRDDDEPICIPSIVSDVSSTSPVTLYAQYTIDHNAPDYEDQIREILMDLQANGVESVLGCSYKDLCIHIPAMAKQLDYNPDGMMFVICDIVQEVRDTLGYDSEYVMGITPWVPTVNTYDTYVGWTAQEFQDRFVATYNVEPTTIGASAFAGIEILVATIEAAQSLDPDVISQHISSTSYSTFYANISFDSNNQANMVMLVWQMRLNNSNFIMDTIVDPPEMATAAVVWPVPPWSQRQCTRDTFSCSSHGACNAEGTCICDENYYGSMLGLPCDTFCDGEIKEDTGVCHSNRKFYIGGLVDFESIDKDETIATMNFAVDLINNYTDDWFDTTRQVTLVLNIADSMCSRTGGDAAARWLNNWAISTSEGGTTLDGYIGATCSDASIGASRFGNTIIASQIAFGSTSTVLADKDEYIYFARTCFADDSQGQLLADALDDVGLVPFIAVISSSDSYAQSLSFSIIENYQAKGHIVLLNYQFTPVDNETAVYTQILDEIAASGAPVTVLVMYADEVEHLLAAVAEHPVYKYDTMVWVGIEMWVNVKGPWNKKGMVGLKPYVPSTNITASYMDLWANLNPAEFIDSDGDRSSLGSNTLYVADAVFALAQAFQKVTGSETGSSGDALKREVFTHITNDVEFKGVSGPVDFLSNGNRGDPIFGFANYGENSWIRNGYTDLNGIHVRNYSEIVWPDNTTGRATTYSSQRPLYCPAGTESTQTSISPVIFGCTRCRVGFYKPDVGPQLCAECPEGTDCNNVGITVPCISKGYWRAQPENSNDLGDFHKYKVYSCDITEGCISGCQLNETCAAGREGISVTCGVCMDGYYLNHRGKCLLCTDDDMFTPASVIGVYVGAVAMLGVLYFILVRVLVGAEIGAIEAQSLSDNKIDSAAIVTPPDGPNTSVSKVQSAALAVKMNLLGIVSPQNFRDTMITAKIVLAFFQVMSSFFALDLNDRMTSGFQELFTSYNMNPFRGNEDFVACSSVSEDILPYYFIVLNSIFLPLIVIVLFIFVSYSVYQYYRYQLIKKCHNSSPFRIEKKSSISLTQEQEDTSNALSTKIKSTLTRIVLWLCLVFYPSICSIVLSVFNCRDFGTSGVWLRVDNEINCESDTYKGYLALASIGVVVYVAGIPALFYYAIKNRHRTLWHFSSRFLHHGFVDEWKYYEIVDLLRKLLITSVSQFVGSPSSPTQILFMLVINCCFLYILSIATPYQSTGDNNLSTLLTTIECISFLFALLVVSGITESEGYNESAMSNSLMALFIVSLFMVAPYTFITKIDYFERKIDNAKETLKRCFPEGSENLPDLALLSKRGRERTSSWRNSQGRSSSIARPSDLSAGDCEMSSANKAYSVNSTIHSVTTSPMQ